MIELSAANNNVTRLRRLQHKRAAREAEGCIVVEGITAVRDAIRAGRARSVFVRAGEAPTVESMLASGGSVPVYVLDAKTFDGVATTVAPQAALAVVDWQPATIDDLALDQGPAIVLDGVGDPGNVGTIVRVADAAGACAVFAGPRTADVTAPKVVRSATGALLRVPVVTALTTTAAIAALRARSVRCVGAVAHGGIPYDEFDWLVPVAIVMGSEAHGIDGAVDALLDAEVSIDMSPGAESLNVAVACAVLSFEIRRRRPKTRQR